MIKIKRKPSYVDIKMVTFDNPVENQRLAVKMSIALSKDKRRKLLSAPDVGVQISLLVMRNAPQHMFNPVITNDNGDTMVIEYSDYLGNRKRQSIETKASVKSKIEQLRITNESES